MKASSTFLAATMAALMLAGCNKEAPAPPAGKAVASAAPAADTKITLKDDKDKVSYSIGLNLGRSMKSDGLDINPDLLAAAMKDVLAGVKPQLTDEEAQTIMQNFQKQMMSRQMALREKAESEATAAAPKHKAEGEKFLAENKSKEGVKTTASGLQYKVIKDGTGKTPKATDTVSTHYRGTFINGDEFDSSYKRNMPAEFPVNGVIKGWTEALLLMKEGAKWQLFIPSNLAYGDAGRQSIPPSSTLIFDIELIKVQAGQ